MCFSCVDHNSERYVGYIFMVRARAQVALVHVCSLPKVRIFFGICKFFKKKVKNIMKKGVFLVVKAARGGDNRDNLRLGD